MPDTIRLTFTYPTEEEYGKISHALVIFDRFIPLMKALDEMGDGLPYDRPRVFQAWHLHLFNRLLGKAQMACVMATFYLDRGIPDDEKMASNRSGTGIEFYPQLDDDHWSNKFQFDYHAEFLYHVLFAAWDTIGHLLNVLYDLGIREEKVSFKEVVKCNKMASDHATLCSDLQAIISSQHYIDASELRNSITHRYLPGHVDAGSSRRSMHHLMGNIELIRELRNHGVLLPPAARQPCRWGDLIWKLRTQGDPVSGYLWSQFSPALQEELRGYTGSVTPSMQVQTNLVNALSKELQDADLYQDERFSAVHLRESTKIQIKAKRRPDGQDLERLNQSLLEDAYPQEIPKGHTINHFIGKYTPSRTVYETIIHCLPLLEKTLAVITQEHRSEGIQSES